MSDAVTKNMAHRAVLEGKPIELYGLKLWGIPMRQYEEWAKCKIVWTARQSTFPVFCISMSFLDALLALDIQAMDETGTPAGYMNRILYGLCMALRMDVQSLTDGRLSLTIDESKKKLKAIVIRQPDGNGTAEITPHRFNAVRQAVAWMQGEEVPDESMNDELVEAASDLAQRNAPKLNYDLTDMISSVASAYGIRAREILEWPILEFESARRAVDRRLKYMICGIGATNGCKWDGGNPYPSWCYDRLSEGTAALISPDKFGKAKQH